MTLHFHDVTLRLHCTVDFIISILNFNQNYYLKKNDFNILAKYCCACDGFSESGVVSFSIPAFSSRFPLMS